jgi:hypothetical protein
MTSRATSAVLRKEVRAIGPMWLAFAASMLSAAWVGFGLEMVVFVAGVFLLSAWSMGHEYSHRTLQNLLGAPIDRRRLFALKFGVLAVAALALAVMVVAIERYAGREATIPGLFRGMRLGLGTAVVLPLTMAYCLGPLFTMAGRSPIAGAVFPGAVLCLIWLTGDLLGIARFGLGQDQAAAVDALRTHVTWRAALLLSALGAVLTWRTFLRLEAIDTVAEWQMPALRRRAAAGHPVAARLTAGRSHWLRRQIPKELRLQRMVFLIAPLYVVAWTAIVATRHLLSPALTLPLSPITVIYAGVVALLLGSFASAEERQLGTHAWQTMLPVPAWRQWAVKVLVALALNLLLCVLLPRALESMTAIEFGIDDVKEIWWPWLLVGMTVVSLYVSSASQSGLRALVASIVIAGPIVLATVVAAGSLRPLSAYVVQLLIETGWYRSGGYQWMSSLLKRGAYVTTMEQTTTSIVAGMVAGILLLALALRNHRGLERRAGIVLRQAALVCAVMIAFVIAAASLNAMSVNDWRRTGAEGLRVRGHVVFDGATPLAASGAERLDLMVAVRPIERPGAATAGASLTLMRLVDTPFATTFTDPGRVVVQGYLSGKTAWDLESIMWRGQDISLSPIDLTSGLDDVVIRLSDHLGEITGAVRYPEGTSAPWTTVVLIPADVPVDQLPRWLVPRRLWFESLKPSTVATVPYSLKMPLDGDYWLAAVRRETFNGLRGPDRWKTLAAMGERIHVTRGTTITVNLSVKQ